MKQIKWKQYVIDGKPIGKGLYSRVYSGYDEKRQRKVAIKEVSDVAVGEREATIMKKYGVSKFLPRYYDFFIRKKKAYIVMEYVKGKALGGNFNCRGRKFEEKVAIQITINILKGLRDLHRAGFYHRDIKPKNIMTRGKLPETIKIIDFNISRIIEDEDSIQKDLRNTALMCIFLLNGFVPESVDEAMIDNAQLREVILKTFSKKVEDRYPSAKAFIDALKPYQ